MLVCTGAAGKWRSPASVEYAAELAPAEEGVAVEERGHCPQVEEIARFDLAVAAFVASA